MSYWVLCAESDCIPKWCRSDWSLCCMRSTPSMWDLATKPRSHSCRYSRIDLTLAKKWQAKFSDWIWLHMLLSGRILWEGPEPCWPGCWFRRYGVQSQVYRQWQHQDLSYLTYTRSLTYNLKQDITDIILIYCLDGGTLQSHSEHSTFCRIHRQTPLGGPVLQVVQVLLQRQAILWCMNFRK